MGAEVKYMVNISGKDAFMAVVGKACYLNCRNVNEFFSAAFEKGCAKMVLNCKDCAGMDSTFLGMVAGAALKLKKRGGEFVFLNLEGRNLEIVENLGIAKFARVLSDSAEAKASGELKAASAGLSMILGAHENLIEADASNLAKFEDVVAFLKKEKGA